MSESFDHAATNPASGGENLAGDRFSQAGTSLFLPASYLVFGPADGPFTRVESATGLPVAQAGDWTVALDGVAEVTATALDIRPLSHTADSIAAHQAGTWSVAVPDPVTVTASNLDIRNLTHAADSVAAVQSGTWTVASITNPVTVQASNLDIRNLAFATDSVTVLQGAAWVIAGTVSVDSELPAAVVLADDLANPTTPLAGACQLLFNGATWDRRPGTRESALLPSASRNVTTSSTVQTNHGARGVIVWLDLSIFNGGTGLTLQLWAVDPVSGRAGCLASWGPRTGTAQVHWLELSPGAASAAGDAYGARFQGALPRRWFVTVSHATATAHTYGVSCSLLP